MTNVDFHFRSSSNLEKLFHSCNTITPAIHHPLMYRGRRSVPFLPNNLAGPLFFFLLTSLSSSSFPFFFLFLCGCVLDAKIMGPT